MGVDHLGVGQLRQETERAARASRRVAKATLQNASIGHAGIRVYDGGWIRIEDGGLQVTGTATVTGTLTGSGTFDWTGPMNLQGAQTITGPTTFTGQMTVNGPWKFVGNGQITGDVDVTGNIKVLPGGKIQVGNIVIDPTISGGAVTFANGAQVFTDASTIQVFKGGSVVQVSNDYARLQHGGTVVEINGSGMRASLAAVSTISGTGTPQGVLFQDASGYFRRSDGS